MTVVCRLLYCVCETVVCRLLCCVCDTGVSFADLLGLRKMCTDTTVDSLLNQVVHVVTILLQRLKPLQVKLSFMWHRSDDSISTGVF